MLFSGPSGGWLETIPESTSRSGTYFNPIFAINPTHPTKLESMISALIECLLLGSNVTKVRNLGTIVIGERQVQRGSPSSISDTSIIVYCITPIRPSHQNVFIVARWFS